MPDLVRRHPRPQPDRTWRARFERALHLSSALCVHLEMRSRTVAASLFQLSKAGHAIRVKGGVKGYQWGGAKGSQ
jgi:hypothetical protein